MKSFVTAEDWELFFNHLVRLLIKQLEGITMGESDENSQRWKMIKKIKNVRVSDGNVIGLVYWDVSDDEEFYWDLP